MPDSRKIIRNSMIQRVSHDSLTYVDCPESGYRGTVKVIANIRMIAMCNKINTKRRSISRLPSYLFWYMLFYF